MEPNLKPRKLRARSAKRNQRPTHPTRALDDLAEDLQRGSHHANNYTTSSSPKKQKTYHDHKTKKMLSRRTPTSRPTPPPSSHPSKS
jgi:hypothetical protein